MTTAEIRAALDAHDAADAAQAQALTDVSASYARALERVVELEAEVARLQSSPAKVLIGEDWSPLTAGPSTLSRFMATVDTDRGTTIRTTLPQSTAGPRWTCPLPEPMEAGWIEYDLRFTGAWGKGLKLAPGLGGILPGNPEGRTTPPSGGAPTEYGWSTRLMANTKGGGGLYADAANHSLYQYLPTLPPSSYGKGIQVPGSLGPATRSDGQWRHHKISVGMNTTGQTNGTLGLAVDGEPVLERADMPWRLHEGVQVSHLVWSQFYGGDSTWAGVGGGVVDIANLRVVKIR